MRKQLLLVPVLAAGVLTSALLIGCSGGDDEKTVRLGDQTFIDKGTQDASGRTTFIMEADDFYFEPTFVRGTAGQKLTLQIENESSVLHNISVPSQLVDVDLPANGQVDVDVTFPASGVLLFLCKYHTAQGMNGELLAGSAEPAAASAATAAPTVKLRAAGGELGTFLVDNSGRTLYLYKNDEVGSGKSNVSGNLANAWPPLTLAAGTPIKTPDITGDLTLITRDDGSKQVAYKGQPLYYFAQDTNVGDTNGQARGNVWYVVAP
jgi:predicted lipoprotein with Yx(FWY)xxD motif